VEKPQFKDVSANSVAVFNITVDSHFDGHVFDGGDYDGFLTDIFPS
jgi:hypothetical protein